jgi:peptidoglycan/xylan/chitin deacetylase (PgdA/CDA1 family)
MSPKPYFRFPYGERTEGHIQAANMAGYLSVYWSVDPQDWRSGTDAAALYGRVMQAMHPGAIVLMHGIDPGQKAGALPAIINDLWARGYQPVTLTELLLEE